MRFELTFTDKKLSWWNKCKQLSTRILLISNCCKIVLKGGKKMDIGTAILIGLIVGACIAGGIIYSGLEKLAKAIEKQK